MILIKLSNSKMGNYPKRNVLPPKKAGFAIFANDAAGNLRLLITQSPYGRIGLPKGQIEIGEDPLAAAIRETREETGFEIGKLPRISSGEITIKDSNSRDGKYSSVIYHIDIGKLPGNLAECCVAVNSAEISFAWFESVEKLMAADETTILTKKFLGNYYKKKQSAAI